MSVDDLAKAAGWTDLAVAESWLGSNSHPVRPEHRVAIRAELARLRLVEQAATTLVEQVWDEETQTFCCVNHLRSGLDALAAAVHGETP